MDHPDITAYIKEAELIERMYIDLLKGTTQKRMKRVDDGSTGLQNVEYHICVINSKNEPLQSVLLQRYGEWYEGCLGLFKEYAGRAGNSKCEEFAGLNKTIISLIGLKDPVSNSNDKSELRKEFRASFDPMVSMLHSIEPPVVSARNNNERMLAADLINSELDEAESLYQQGYVSSAATVADEALESYLKMLCEVNGVEPEPEETMAAIVQRLRESDEAKGFDQELLVTLEQLVALRDRCASADETEQSLVDDVRELIDQTRELVFLMFC
ncbi:hypothetical protein [Methanolobus sp. WCC4]|uniref:hypothetical protein n=1 Tax=Methanolobus sp. WCC4 TaxID=3125784 RepID=UPI0030F9F224